MLKDEFNQLMSLFHEGVEGKKVNLHLVFTKAMAFFEHFKEEFERASPEEKRELLDMMVKMNQEISRESKKILSSSGMTEEQLLAFAENPSNFSPEQWQEFQDSKSQIHQAGMQLVKEVQKALPSQKPKAHSVQPIEKKGQHHGSHNKPRKSDWQRS